MQKILIFLFAAACVFPGWLAAEETTPPAPQPLKMDAPGPGRPAPFTAEMSAEFMRKVMETSARIEKIRNQIAERRQELFETDDSIKEHRAALVELQTQINAILDEDPEISRLRMESDILWTTMPSMPHSPMRPGAARNMFPPPH
ncbi:MAG: hypothetical protein ABR497_05470 [Kiritimatiellia bacterium]|nr:hypothetical protein [Lentisphaerota bacterium]